MPISSFGFMLKAFEHLYFARTNIGNKIFTGQPLNESKGFPKDYRNTVVEQVGSEIYNIKLKPC